MVKGHIGYKNSTPLQIGGNHRPEHAMF